MRDDFIGGDGNLRKSRPGAPSPTPSLPEIRIPVRGVAPPGRSAGRPGDTPEELPILEVFHVGLCFR